MRSFAIAALFVFARTAPASDALTSFLERHHLNELLALQLEDQLDAADESAIDVREELILRLASVYASLLERERDETRRSRLEQRSRQLLSRAPPNSADELRLALIRTSYLLAEDIAERHRLRQAGEEEIERAKMTLDDVVPELQQMVRYYDSAVSQTNARLARAAGPEAAALYERLDRMERMRGSCRFLLAWSLYYRLWLRGETNTEGAERQFAEVLLADVARPQPEDVSIDLRAFEPVARAIVGMALCKSLSSNNSTMALRWINLLEDEQTFATVREQAPVWRLVIHLEHGEFREAKEWIESRIEAEEELPVLWVRLAAVAAIESDRNPADARTLLDTAIAQLAAAGELAQILDLAERYGSDRLGTHGFAVRYVNGLIRYREARDMQNNENAEVAAIRAHYRNAEVELRAALNERDAAIHPSAAAACRRLLAWSLYFQSEYLKARQEFEIAAKELPAADAPEALWMAIVCLDRLVQSDSGRNESLVAERELLIDRFLETYPASPRSATLLVSRASHRDALSDEEITRLLAIPPNHESYYPARRRVSHVLYQRFRNARQGSAARISAGEAFLGVAAPLLDSQRAFAVHDNDDEEAATSMRLTHIRRVLEVALHDGIANLSAARRAIAAASRIESTYPELIAAYRHELDYRQLQERLYSDDASNAANIADVLWEESHELWARLASRAMFQHNHSRWREGDASTSILQSVVRYGGRVLREFEDDDGALRRSNVLSYHAAVAEASFTLWKEHGEASEGPRALFLYQRMITAHPRQAQFLKPGAILATAFDEHEFAAECWRTLSAGVETGSDDWYEARAGLIRSLAEIDPARAREVMDQHKQLHPDYGPPPWGHRLRALDESIQWKGPA